MRFPSLFWQRKGQDHLPQYPRLAHSALEKLYKDLKQPLGFPRVAAIEFASKDPATIC